MTEHMEGQPTQPAGWYPVADGSQRYWDGTQWTEHTAPAAGAVQPGAVQQGAMQPGAIAGQPAGGYVAGALTNDEKTMGMLAHLLAVVLGFLGPLIIWLMKKDESAFVDFHGKESLNFQITLFMAWMVAFVLLFVFVGIFLMPLLFLVQLIMPIMAAIAANKGEYYRYPATLRLIT